MINMVSLNMMVYLRMDNSVMVSNTHNIIMHLIVMINILGKEYGSDGKLKYNGRFENDEFKVG